MTTEIGITISPFTGQKILGVKKLTDEKTIFIREIEGKKEHVELTGEKGSIFNYVTLEHYGKGTIIKKLK